MDVMSTPDTPNTEVPMDIRHVLVTTEHRGVFAGRLVEDNGQQSVTLEDARMCVRWSTDARGVVGLAHQGPTKACRITPAAPRIKLYGVTAVMDLTPEAQRRWENEPWG